MYDTSDFNTQLITILNERKEYFDTIEMEKILSNYRKNHSVLSNLINILIRKGLIKTDPYKHEKKISTITLVPDTPITDHDKSMSLGIRLSDFDSILDFICNYYKFSLSTLTNEDIAQLVKFNNCFVWANMSMTSSKPNTKMLAEIINTIKQSGDSITASVVVDCISLLAQVTKEIDDQLKKVLELQNELYKATVRKNILLSPDFDRVSASTLKEFQIQVRNLFQSKMPQKPFYAELIEEIAREELSDNKERLQADLLERFSRREKPKEIKTIKVDMKEILMNSLYTLSSSATQLEQIRQKIEYNQKFLESLNITFSTKLIKTIRKMFWLPEKPVEYIVSINEHTGSARTATIVYNDFMRNLINRTKTYASLSIKKSAIWQKLVQATESQVFDYLNKQIIECQRLIIELNALDNYFKNNEKNSLRVRGLKIEIATMKTIVQKANQSRAEYISQMEEKNQLEKLGIKND